MASTAAAAAIVKDLPELLKQGLEIYKTLRDDMERALGLKQYADSLAELNSIMNGVSKYLDQEEKNIVKILVEANDLTQKGMQKAIVVVSVIKSQCDLLLAVLQQNVPAEQQKERFYTACVYFGAFAKDIEAKITEAENELVSASNKLYEARLKIVTVTDTLKRVHDTLSSEMEEALAKQRATAYGAAAAGAIFGPIGLIISYSIAAGVTEGKTVNDLRQQFSEQRDKVSDYIKDFDTMKNDTDSLKASLDKNKDSLTDIHAKLSSAGTIAEIDVSMMPLPSFHFNMVRTSVNGLRESCEKFLESVKK